MKPLEIFISSESKETTKDISKLIPIELLVDVIDTVLDPDIQKNGHIHKLSETIIDPFGREIDTVSLPSINSLIDQNCWILDIIHIMFNTILKVEEGHLNEEFKSHASGIGRITAAVHSYINKALSDNIWGKDGLFRELCVAHRSIDTARAVALPNPYYGIDWLGVPRSAMQASERKHGDFCLVTRFPAIWDGSIEVMRARASGNDCIEIHPLLHKQLNLDHDGDPLTLYWIPKDDACYEEAKENVLQFFIKESLKEWPKELTMSNNSTGSSYETDDLDDLSNQTKKRLVPNGLSIDPTKILSGEHNLDEIMNKEYREDTAIIARGLKKSEFYERSININQKNLTMKMFMGAVGVTSNDIRLIGKNGSDKVRRSAMYISEAIQQALLDSKHEIGSPNNMRFMIMKDAIGGVGSTGKDITKIMECLEDNKLDQNSAFPFIAHMYLILPAIQTIEELCNRDHVDSHSKNKMKNIMVYHMNFTDFNVSNHKDVKISIKKAAVDYLNCASDDFAQIFDRYSLNLRDYILIHFPIYSLITKASTADNRKQRNELSKCVLIDHNIDPYGSCADEYKILGD